MKRFKAEMLECWAVHVRCICIIPMFTTYLCFSRQTVKRLWANTTEELPVRPLENLCSLPATRTKQKRTWNAVPSFVPLFVLFCPSLFSSAPLPINHRLANNGLWVFGTTADVGQDKGMLDYIADQSRHRIIKPMINSYWDKRNCPPSFLRRLCFYP